MRSLSIRLILAMAVLSCSGSCFAQKGAADENATSGQRQRVDSARAYQRELDVNPSSARAHEGLGVALFQQLVAQGARPADYNDVVERATTHLKEASQLQPAAPGPLLELSDLEAFLAERSANADERNEHYREAQDLLKRVLTIVPPKPEIYLKLATLEYDQFGPPLQDAKTRFPKAAGPIPDVELRRGLHETFGATIDDAISNAQQATAANARSQRPLLLLSRIFRERALLQDTPDQYAADMQSAKSWEQQFLATGGHLDTAASRSR